MKSENHFSNSPGNNFDGVTVAAYTPTIERPLTAQELAPIIGLHHVTILRWARENRIPHRRLGPRTVLFIPSEIQAWLASSDSNLYTVPATRAAQPERTAA